MKKNILILAAGKHDEDRSVGDFPACLQEGAGGKTLLEEISSKLEGIEGANFIFAFSGKDVDKYSLDKSALMLRPGAQVIKVHGTTAGSACTALFAACQIKEDVPLLIVSANEIVDIDYAQLIDNFHQSKLDAGVIVFNSIHPRYSYVKLDDEGLVVEAAQQKPISQNATTGTFWFARTSEFSTAVKKMIRKNSTTSKQFYIAPVLNELILNQKKIGVLEIDNDLYHPLKNNQQIQTYVNGNL